VRRVEIPYRFFQISNSFHVLEHKTSGGYLLTSPVIYQSWQKREISFIKTIQLQKKHTNTQNNVAARMALVDARIYTSAPVKIDENALSY
jgi:hypothetical protein